MPEHFVVVGAGTMGAGIAYVAGLAGYRVTVCEVDSERATAALDSIRGWAQTNTRSSVGKSEPGTAARVQADISTVSDISLAPRDASVFVEAVPEQPDLKRRVLDAAQERSPQLLASNTSSISITELASGLDAPDRFRRVALSSTPFTPCLSWNRCGRTHFGSHPQRGARRRRPARETADRCSRRPRVRNLPARQRAGARSDPHGRVGSRRRRRHRQGHVAGATDTPWGLSNSPTWSGSTSDSPSPARCKRPMATGSHRRSCWWTWSNKASWARKPVKASTGGRVDRRRHDEISRPWRSTSWTTGSRCG